MKKCVVVNIHPNFEIPRDNDILSFTALKNVDLIYKRFLMCTNIVISINVWCYFAGFVYLNYNIQGGNLRIISFYGLSIS